MLFFVRLCLFVATCLAWFVGSVEILDGLLIARSHPLVVLFWASGWGVLGWRIAAAFERFVLWSEVKEKDTKR